MVPVVRSRGRNLRQWIDLAIGAASFALPVLMFEAWKVSALGTAGYLSNWAEFRKFLTSTGGTAAGGPASSLGSLVAKHSAALHVNYGFGKFQLFLVPVALGVVVHLYAEHETRLFCWLLMAAGAAHLTWYVASSNGNPRYALMGLLLLAAAAACVVFARPPVAAVAAAVGVVVIAVVPAYSQLGGPLNDVRHGNMFRPTQRVMNLEATADFLAKAQHKDPFVGSWWATVAEREYMLPTASRGFGEHHGPVLPLSR